MMRRSLALLALPISVPLTLAGCSDQPTTNTTGSSGPEITEHACSLTGGQLNGTATVRTSTAQQNVEVTATWPATTGTPITSTVRLSLDQPGGGTVRFEADPSDATRVDADQAGNCTVTAATLKS